VTSISFVQHLYEEVMFVEFSAFLTTEFVIRELSII